MKKKNATLTSIFATFVLGFTNVFAQTANPYAQFGYEGRMLQAEQEQTQKQSLVLFNSDTTQNIRSIVFDTKNQLIKYYDKNNQAMGTYSLSATDMLKFLSVDPLAEKYPSISPYAFVANNPINAIDPDGRKIVFIVGEGKQTRNFTYRNGNFYDVKTNQRYNPGKENVSKTLFKVLTAYRIIEKSNDEVLKNQLHTLEQSELKHFVGEGNDNSVKAYGLPTGVNSTDRTGTLTYFNFSEEVKNQFKDSEKIPNSDLSIVSHEMRHQYDLEIGNMSDDEPSNHAGDPSEIRGVNNENRARKIENLPKRTTYGGRKIDPKKLESPPNNVNMPLKK